MEHGPVGLEGLDDRLISYMQKKGLHPKDVKLLPDGSGWLLVEFDGASKAESDDKARQVMAALKEKGDAPSMKLFDDPAEEAQVWEVRESGLGATATRARRSPPAGRAGKIPPCRPSMRAPTSETCGSCSTSTTTTAHSTDTSARDASTSASTSTWRRMRASPAIGRSSMTPPISWCAMAAHSPASMATARRGPRCCPACSVRSSSRRSGSSSALWDPEGKMNPGQGGRSLCPHRQPAPRYRSPSPSPLYPLRVSRRPRQLRRGNQALCRRGQVPAATKAGTMCPSYMATREEAHSTRGRARLLFEFLQGDVIGQRGWRDESVRDALDLCLACKGCKADCPVNVDMATYKAEYLSHYYEGRLRPRQAYAFGLIMYWSRLAGRMPQAWSMCWPMRRDWPGSPSSCGRRARAHHPTLCA